MYPFFKHFLTLTAAICLSGAMAFGQSSMTDQQVLDYAKQAVAEGRTQKEVARELMLKGVDRAQAERVRRLYEQQQRVEDAASPIESGSRAHSIADNVSGAAADQSIKESSDMALEVYGRRIFRDKNLNFAPSENLATPRNYRLGPGDEVIIDIFGANQTTIRQTISPEGSINIDILGPVYLNGKTVEEANTFLRKKLSSIYAGLDTSDGETSSIRLTLGQIRTIQVNMIDNVSNPGTYQISGLSTVFHALYRAGGPSSLGTLRNIFVMRNGRRIGSIDVYEFMQTGKSEGDIRLEDGDVILVPEYKCVVKLAGMVKRPMMFELKERETLSNLFAYAGGFVNGAYTESVTVSRQNGKSYLVHTVAQKDFATFYLQDGDEIEVRKLNGLFENKLSISGAVFQPGSYELSADVHTVRQLLAQAGGLMPEAFTQRIVITRTNDDRTLEVLSANLENILNGTEPDIELRKNDNVTISSKFEMTDQATMTIIGLVQKPASYPFAAHTTIEDLIVIAGGLKAGASTSKVTVSRRMRDASGLKATREIAESFEFEIQDGLVQSGNDHFYLEPYDEVIVHKSPSYNVQEHATVLGQVNFPGTFTLSSRAQRLSELVAQAGGLTDFAYVRGARLFRQRSATEISRLREERSDALQRGDTLAARAIDLDGTYSVAIDLGKALENPGEESDLVLREGDRLEIPVYDNSVRVSGAVQNPGGIAYYKGLSARKAIMMCGGFAQRAKKSKAYIIGTNGATRDYHRWSKLKPGEEVVVPLKEKKQNILQNTAALSSTVSILAALSTMVIAITK